MICYYLVFELRLKVGDEGCVGTRCYVYHFVYSGVFVFRLCWPLQSTLSFLTSTCFTSALLRHFCKSSHHAREARHSLNFRALINCIRTLLVSLNKDSRFSKLDREALLPHSRLHSNNPILHILAAFISYNVHYNTIHIRRSPSRVLTPLIQTPHPSHPYSRDRFRCPHHAPQDSRSRSQQP
jgi:hypothetical protein